ncbi:Tetratricopeptide repeat protein 28 [Stylophora pistillata]|uniref:Tetratricopeptide repeat protein 28 n=1 Tax=Stylophora pistillata TaxID=50429 RepID=A0A2B4SLM5_STYPI|nr:Tetratricopeptide repeat protein 28 [Stylophora pistillata]
MSEDDVCSLLCSKLPVLQNRRFCCASAVDNRTRLEFNGEKRIWDGQDIRKNIKGNSALYILEIPHDTVEDSSGIDAHVVSSDVNNSEGDFPDLNDVSFKISINPQRVPLQGGYPFVIKFTPDLPPNVIAGYAVFEELRAVRELDRSNNNSLVGYDIPPAERPGMVKVRVQVKEDLAHLGTTSIEYFNTQTETLKQLVHDPNLQNMFFKEWANGCGKSCTTITDGILHSSQFGFMDPSASGLPSVQGLKLLVYTAAETGGQKFLEVVFNSSAGSVVFNAYKNIPLLPEAVARTNGYEDTAQFLESITKRLSAENTTGEEQFKVDHIVELAKCAEPVQEQLLFVNDNCNQLCVVSFNPTDHSSFEGKSPLENDGIPEVDYFGDAEISSSNESEQQGFSSEDECSHEKDGNSAEDSRSYSEEQLDQMVKEVQGRNGSHLEHGDDPRKNIESLPYVVADEESNENANVSVVGEVGRKVSLDSEKTVSRLTKGVADDSQKEVGDKAGEGRAYANLGSGYHMLADFGKAIEYHERHLKIGKEVGDKVGEGRTYGNIGSCCRNLCDFKKAIEYHKCDLQISKEVGDKAGEGMAYGNLGNCYRSLGDFKKAIEYHERYLPIAKEVGDKAGEGGAYGNLANAYHSLGDLERAIQYHKRHLKNAKKVGDKAGEGRAYGNLGNAYHSLGDFERAIQYYERHLKNAKSVGDKAGEGGAYGNLGNAYHSLGDFERAIQYHERYLKNAKEVGDKGGEGQAHGSLGNAYHSLGDFERAIQYHESHLENAKEVGDKAGEGQAHGNLGNAYHSLGDFERAIQYHERHLKNAKEVAPTEKRDRAEFAKLLVQLLYEYNV